MIDIDKPLPDGPRPVFVVSTGRSGSQMIAHALRAHPRICALHEPPPHLYVESLAKWRGTSRAHRVLLRVAMKRTPLITQVIENGYAYVESSLYCAHLIPELRRLFGAKFVHLHRDVGSFVESGLKRGWYAPAERGGPGVRLRAVLRRRLMIDVGNPGIDHRLEAPADLSRPQKIAWLWCQINGAILRGLAAIPPEDTMTMPVETANRGALERLLDFVGLAPDERWISRMDEIAQTRPNRSGSTAKATLGDEDLQAVAQIAGGMRRQLGYTR